MSAPPALRVSPQELNGTVYIQYDPNEFKHEAYPVTVLPDYELAQRDDDAPEQLPWFTITSFIGQHPAWPPSLNQHECTILTPGRIWRARLSYKRNGDSVMWRVICIKLILVG